MGLGAAALALPGMACVSRKPGSAKNPNIIFIMTDDMGIGDTTVYNAESKIPTPNMENMAKEGVVFTDGHSSSSMCTPSRYSLLTGHYTFRTWMWRGVFGGYNRHLIPKERMTIASLLKENGYSTACVGKWHVGFDWPTKDGTFPPTDIDNIDYTGKITEGPNDRGFDYFFGTSGCTTDDPPLAFIENDQVTAIPSVMAAVDPADELRTLPMVPGWLHEDADIEYTNRSISWIEDQVKSDKDRPFFLYLALSVPHVPWYPHRKFKGASEAGPRGDQVVAADWTLGQIMETLDRLGISDNTLLVFTSDNGPREGINGHTASGKYRGSKGSLYEGGHRVPFLFKWPEKIKGGTVCDQVIGFTDMLATFAAILGTELPNDAGEDSFNVLPAIVGEQLDKPIRDSIIQHNNQLAIRVGDWKLIPRINGNGTIPERGPRGLFNIKDDPYEKNNLYDKHPEIVDRLKKELKKQMEQGYSRPMTI